jgi:hypothetical protein
VLSFDTSDRRNSSIHCWNITAELEEQPEELKEPVSTDIKYQNRKDIERYNNRLEDRV